MKESKPFIEGVHYYLENGRVIFTALFLSQRGQCCGNGCRHCPYKPTHKKGNTVTQEEDFNDKPKDSIFNKTKL